MSDYGLFLDDMGQIDIQFANGDVSSDDGLETAVLISLFSDARAEPDLIPATDRDGDFRGFWGDITGTLPGDSTGSLLWTIRRAKQLTTTLAAAQAYAKASLRWLIDDRIATRVEVVCTYPRRSWMLIEVFIYRPESSNPVSFRYNYEWSAQLLKVNS